MFKQLQQIDQKEIIPFNNFKKEFQNYKGETEQAIGRVLESGWYILGKELEAFEYNFADFIGAKYCVGVASGTEAISLALMALGIERDDEVITTNLNAFPTITAIIQAGAIPVVVDALEDTGLIDWNKIEAKINAKTKAIVPVHLFGQSCEMDQIMQIARENKLVVVEDCAQATGASFGNDKCGSIGDCGAFSFYPTKNLGAYGDAGAITTNDYECYQKLISYRNYGQTKRYYHDNKGINSRLDEMQAAILNVKLKHLKLRNHERALIASTYRQNLKTVICLKKEDYGQHANHLFVVKAKDRDGMMQYLQDNGIQSLIHYPVPINQQKSFLWQKEEEFPVAQCIADSILSIPIDPFLTANQITKIIDTINEYPNK